MADKMPTVTTEDLKVLLREGKVSTSEMPIQQGRSKEVWPIRVGEGEDEGIIVKGRRNGKVIEIIIGQGSEGETVKTSHKTCTMDYVSLVSGAWLETLAENPAMAAMRLGLCLIAYLSGCPDPVIARDLRFRLEALIRDGNIEQGEWEFDSDRIGFVLPLRALPEPKK